MPRSTTRPSSSGSRTDHPTLLLFGMAVVMTVPMVAWMRRRCHAWAPSLEMSVPMLLPTLGVLALLWSGTLTDIGELLVIRARRDAPEHARGGAARRGDYTAHHCHAMAP